jgi:hypothetical protein
VSVPTDVILVWAGAITDCAVGTVETFAPFTLDNPDAFPVRRSARKTPDTVNDVNCPTDVMLGWAGWETTRATLALATFPTSTLLRTFVRPLPWPVKKVAVMLPDE